MSWYIYIILIDTNWFKQKLTVAFCTKWKILWRCNTKDRMEASNFGRFLITFMMDITDIIVSSETRDQIAPELINGDTIDDIYQIEKLDLNKIDYPCTPTRIQKRKINENIGYFEKMVILKKFKLKQY